MGNILCPESEASPECLLERIEWEGSRLCSTDLLEIQVFQFVFVTQN